jgi:transposase-like protein
VPLLATREGDGKEMNRNRPDVPARPGAEHRLRALTGAAAEASGRSHPYPPEQVARVLEMAEQTSIREASERTGISAQLISEWRRKARRDLHAAMQELVRVGVPLEEILGPAPDWRSVRYQTADRLAQAAEVIRERAVGAALDGNDRMLRAGAVAINAFITAAQNILASDRRKDPRDMTQAERDERENRILEKARRRAELRVQAVAESVGLGEDGDQLA